MYRGKTHSCLPGKWFELLYSSKQSSSTSFIAPAAVVLSLSQVSQCILHKSFFSGFYSLVIKLTLDRGDSWDSSSSVECMLTNQLPIKKGKKDDRNFRVLLDFIKVCLCEVYKDQNGWLLEIRGDQSGLIWSMSPFLWTASSAPCWQLFCLMGLAPYV